MPIRTMETVQNLFGFAKSFELAELFNELIFNPENQTNGFKSDISFVLTWDLQIYFRRLLFVKRRKIAHKNYFNLLPKKYHLPSL